MRTFRVERMVLGMIRTNCYLLIREDTGETLIVDPADRADRIEAKLTEEHLTPCGVLLTHGHFDHIGAAEELRKRYGIRIYLPEKEEALAGDSFANLSGQWASPFGIKADVLLKDGETLELAGFSIEVKATPGSIPGEAPVIICQMKRFCFPGIPCLQDRLEDPIFLLEAQVRWHVP